MKRDFRPLRKITPFMALLAIAAILPFLSRHVAVAAEGQSKGDTSIRTLSYHRHPPKGPLPVTLDPERFKENPPAYVAYSLAARIKAVLYQEPCFCRCSATRGHRSLLDCYTDDHASVCPICQVEAIFAFKEHQCGKSPRQIRKAMLRGELTRMNVDAYLHDFEIPGAQEATSPPKQN